jgi:hypothetical protein
MVMPITSPLPSTTEYLYPIDRNFKKSYNIVKSRTIVKFITRLTYAHAPAISLGRKQ